MDYPTTITGAICPKCGKLKPFKEFALWFSGALCGICRDCVEGGKKNEEGQP